MSERDTNTEKEGGARERDRDIDGRRGFTQLKAQILPADTRDTKATRAHSSRTVANTNNMPVQSLHTRSFRDAHGTPCV